MSYNRVKGGEKKNRLIKRYERDRESSKEHALYLRETNVNEEHFKYIF